MKTSNKPHGAYVEKSEAEADRLNNPLGSLGNWDYISEKLNAHKEIIEQHGSKVPTPILKDLYKQCGNNDLTTAKEGPNHVQQFAEQKPLVLTKRDEPKERRSSKQLEVQAIL